MDFFRQLSILLRKIISNRIVPIHHVQVAHCKADVSETHLVLLQFLLNVVTFTRRQVSFTQIVLQITDDIAVNCVGALSPI